MNKKPEPKSRNNRHSLAGKKLKHNGDLKKPLKTRSSPWPGEIKLLGMRVATAELLKKKTSEQASRAKRRRKLAKLLYKRARKHAKQAEANLAQARAALDRAMGAMFTGNLPRDVLPAAKKLRATRQRSRSRRALPAPAAHIDTLTAPEPIDVGLENMALTAVPRQRADLNTTTEMNSPDQC
jgi:hypothetical protein